jgi:hypothetical protein
MVLVMMRRNPSSLSAGFNINVIYQGHDAALMTFANTSIK